MWVIDNRRNVSVTRGLGIITIFLSLSAVYLVIMYSEEIKNSKFLSQFLTSESGVKKYQELENAYQEYVAKRKSVVKRYPNLESIDPWKPLIFYFDYFIPAFFCPFQLRRIGALGDGGKWTCGIERYAKVSNSTTPGSLNPCVVYSFGINRESSFEAEVLERTNCEIFGFDASVKNMGPEIPASENHRMHFFPILLGNVNFNVTKTFTLGSLMRMNKHAHIDILKMDIESNEFKALAQILQEFPTELPFDQLLLEIHVPTDNYTGNKSTFAEFYHFWESLEKAGLRPFSKEANLNPTVFEALPTVFEYSFLNWKTL